MTQSNQQSNSSPVQGPDPDLVIPSAHLADDAFVDRVVAVLDSSETIKVERLTMTGGKCDILIDEAPDDQ